MELGLGGNRVKVIYGPVPSWRLGNSLGIDLLCGDEKICTFNCIYCQLGEHGIKITNRAKFVEIERLENELKECKSDANVITFSGMGEPTLASNLGEAIKVVKRYSDLPIAILTNSSLIPQVEVQEALMQLDIVVAKLDASDEELFQRINRPVEGIEIGDIIKALKHFRAKFIGKLALQIMFIEANKEYAEELANLALEMEPDEVQINTPLRRCKVKPLNSFEIKAIKDKFASRGMNTISVYECIPRALEARTKDLNEVRRRRPPFV
jgi:wyosine [tRNA(Phe)-imidazoG37] synthetase (radical SAM superfamily)